MYRLTSITNVPKQTQKVVLPNEKEMDLYVEYKPMQLGWFMTLSYGDVTINNVRIVTSPNVIHQFKNLVPFGIACVVAGDEEPLLQDDFLSARAKLYILDADEVAAFEDFLSGQTGA